MSHCHLVENCHFSCHLGFFWHIAAIFDIQNDCNQLNIAKNIYAKIAKMPKLAKNEFRPPKMGAPPKKHFGHIFSKIGRRDRVPRAFLPKNQLQT